MPQLAERPLCHVAVESHFSHSTRYKTSPAREGWCPVLRPTTPRPSGKTGWEILSRLAKSAGGPAGRAGGMWYQNVGTMHRGAYETRRRCPQRVGPAFVPPRLPVRPGCPCLFSPRDSAPCSPAVHPASHQRGSAREGVSQHLVNASLHIASRARAAGNPYFLTSERLVRPGEPGKNKG